MPRQPRFLFSQSYYHITNRGNNRNTIFKEKEDNLLTDDPFYRELGINKKEKENNYQELIIGETIKKTYNKDIWGSNNQKYAERQKIDRKMKKAKFPV